MYLEQCRTLYVSDNYSQLSARNYGNSTEAVVERYPASISILFSLIEIKIAPAACFALHLDVEIELEACCRSNHRLRDVLCTMSWSRRANLDYASDTSVNAGPINLSFFLPTRDISNRGRLKGWLLRGLPSTKTGVELRCLLFPWILGAGLTVEADEPLDLFSFILPSYRRSRNCRTPRTCV